MKTVLALTALAVLGLCSVAKAERFDHPPDIYAPEWETSFPYQRNVYWTFATDPFGGPTPSGAPGADYEGYDDRRLFDSDFVTYDGAMHWYELLEGLPGSGLLAVDNRLGTGYAAGTAVFHLDNWEIPRPCKNIWLEVDFLDTPDTAAYQSWILPEGYGVTGLPGGVRQLESGLSRFNFWIQVVPNPPWEGLSISLIVPPGNYFLLDQVHIATECVPEPSMLTLLGLGAVAIVLARRGR